MAAVRLSGSESAASCGADERDGLNVFSVDDVPPVGPRVATPPGLVSMPGHQTSDFGTIASDADVPTRYTSDERWSDFAGADQATGQQTPGSIQRGIAGLEAETQGIVTGPISRAPSGDAVFVDGNGGRWDVVSMDGEYFDADRFGGDVTTQLQTPDSMILIDTTYSGRDEIDALDEWISRNLTELEIERLRFVRAELE